MPVPSEYEEAAKEEVKTYHITDEEREKLLRDSRFVTASYISREVCDNLDTLRPDLDHLRDGDGDLDLDDDLSDSDEWNVEAHRASLMVLTATGEAARKIAQVVLGREIEKITFEDLLDATETEAPGEL